MHTSLVERATAQDKQPGAPPTPHWAGQGNQDQVNGLHSKLEELLALVFVHSSPNADDFRVDLHVGADGCADEGDCGLLLEKMVLV